jgi:hypothetical protein
MSDIALNTTTPALRRPRHRVAEIKLPNGDSLVPRADFANETLGTSEKTVQRLDLPTTYIAGVAYVQRNASLQIIAASVHRRNQPATRSNPRRRRV